MIRERAPRPHGWHVADALVRIGVLAWVAAQFLPVYGYTALLGFEAQAMSGFAVTVAGWSGAMLANEPILLLGWTANLWFVAAALARGTRRRRAALTFALVAELTAVLGEWALATFDTSAQVLRLEVGAYVWLVGITAVFVGIAWWFVRPVGVTQPRG